MTGSQEATEDLSQEMKEMAICKQKSPDPLDDGGKTSNFIKRKLLEQYRNSPSAAARIRAIRLLREVSTVE